MLELNTGGDALQVLWIAVLVGAVSSLTAELLIARGKDKDTGVFELPGGRGSRFWDLGSIAAVPVGMVAAVIAAFLFAPGQEHAAGDQVVQDVALGNLILISAIAGLASAGFLTLIQERFLTAAKNAKLESAIQAAMTGLDEVKGNAKGAQAQKEGKRGAKQARPRVRHSLEQARGQTPRNVHRVLEHANLVSDGDTVTLAQEEAPITITRSWSAPEVEAQADEITDAVAEEAVDALGDRIVEQVDAIKATITAAQPAD